MSSQQQQQQQPPTEQLKNLSVAEKEFYVCEVSGNDELNSGLSQDSPLKTPIQAFFLHENPKIYVRKALEGEDSEWKEISGAGLKKAKKGWEVVKKKQGKEEERKKKEAEDKDKKAEEELKRLEEAKSVKITRVQGVSPAEKVLQYLF